MRTVLGTIFRSLAKYLAVFFASLFVLATILVILLFNIENTLLNAGTYKRALVRNNVYGQLPALAEAEVNAMQAFLTDQAGIDSEDMGFMNNLTDQDWQTLLTHVLPPDEARGMIENTLDQVFAVINGETDTASLSLVKLKAHLSGQDGKEVTQYLLNIQPPCTEEQLAQIHSENPDPGQPEFCRPPQPDLPLLTSQWQEKLDSTTAGIPDEVVLIQPPSERLDNGALGNDPIARLNTLRLEIRFSPLLPLVLLVLITLLRVRSLKSWLLWWGVPLLITGLLTMAIDLAIPALLNWAWVNAILPRFPSALSAGITGLIRSLVNSVASALTRPIMLEAAILALIGLAAIIGSFFVKTKFEQPVPSVS